MAVRRSITVSTTPEQDIVIRACRRSGRPASAREARHRVAGEAAAASSRS